MELKEIHGQVIAHVGFKVIHGGKYCVIYMTDKKAAVEMAERWQREHPEYWRDLPADETESGEPMPLFEGNNSPQADVEIVKIKRDN